MTWAIALQTFTAGLAGIGVWFLYELIREYKQFKSQSAADLLIIRKERADFQLAIESTLLKIQQLRHDSESSIKTVNHELEIFKHEMGKLTDEANATREFMRKNYIFAKVLHDKVDLTSKELKQIQDDLKNLKGQ